MQLRVRGLTRNLVAVVFWRQGPNGGPSAGPRAVLIRPRVGADAPITTSGVQRIDAAVLDPADDSSDDPETQTVLLDDVMEWKSMRDELIGHVLELSDFPPNELDASAFDAVVARLEETVRELRSQADDLKRREQDAYSSDALAYIEPVETFEFNRRSGLHSRVVDSETIIGLPDSDGPSARVAYFHVDGRPWRPGSAPDIVLPTDTGRLEIRVKSTWPVLMTNSVRPRQIAAATAALEARYMGQSASACYAAYAQRMNLPDEQPIVVHRLVRSVIRLLLNPSTIDHVRFLAPREVKFNDLLRQLNEREPYEAKIRKRK